MSEDSSQTWIVRSNVIWSAVVLFVNNSLASDQSFQNSSSLFTVVLISEATPKGHDCPMTSAWDLHLVWQQHAAGLRTPPKCLPHQVWTQPKLLESVCWEPTSCSEGFPLNFIGVPLKSIICNFVHVVHNFFWRLLQAIPWVLL